MPGGLVKSDFWIHEYISPYDVYQRGIKRIIDYRKTKFQEMYIVETGEHGKCLVLDGKIQSTTAGEFLYHEALVHPAMVFHGAPKRVLIVGGGEGAVLREVLKWRTVERALMVDIDGEVVEACREHLPEMHQGAFDDPRAEFLPADANMFLSETREKFDVILCDLSDPMEGAPAFELFTKEFYEKVRGVLHEDGIVQIQGGPVNIAELEDHARLHNTVGSVFPHVRTICSFVSDYISLWGFIVGSNSPISDATDADQIDGLLERSIDGDLRFLDAITLQGMICVPKHIRKGIKQHTKVFTRKDPQIVFGTGSVED